MKQPWLLLSLFGVLVSGQDLSKVNSVYLLPMAQGLDQYLATRLTQEHVFQVVTDPKRADAVLTDHIGEAFEDKLATLESNPEPVSSDPSGDQTSPQQPASASNRLSSPAVNSSFSRGKGTIFLVDPKSHRVLWSAYQPPKNSSSGEVNRAASDIVSRLKRDLKAK